MLEGIRLGLSAGLVIVVPIACWRFLQDRRGAVPITVGCVIGYLVLGNLLSQVVLLDWIFPSDPSTTTRTTDELHQLLFVHTLVGMGLAAGTTVAVAAGLARVLQPKG
jgi:hypothetical protein